MKMKYNWVFIVLIYMILIDLIVSYHNDTSSSSIKRRYLTSGNDECNPNPHDPEAISKAVAQATISLNRFDNSLPMTDRLAIMILFSRGFNEKQSSKMNSRLEYLHCALLKLQKQLMTSTPADVYIWGLNMTDNPMIIPTWLNSQELPRVHIMEIPENTWKIPCGLAPDHEWAVRKHFDIDYYLMGRWRLTFSLDFVKAMGYKYHLQFDDDAMLNTIVSYNILPEFHKHSYHMGVFSDLIGEVPQVTLGLPELTAYWMKIRNYQPEGPIFKNLRPGDITGLTSDGWNRMYHPGYFLIISIDFWYSNQIQDYLNTIFRSGRDIEGRWQEQAVMNMIRLIFIPENQLWVMNDIDIGHDRHKRQHFENWCIKSGVLQPSSSN